MYITKTLVLSGPSHLFVFWISLS